MTDEKDGSPLTCNILQFAETLFLERTVPDGKNFVYNQDLRLEMCGNPKSKALASSSVGDNLNVDRRNDLERFISEHSTGRGVWKWSHYLPVYERHLAQFRNKSVNVLEVGIYSGGSLDMWRSYFGPTARIFGVDVEPACRAYQGPGVEIHIGDQADRRFWSRFRANAPKLDVVIDDGGHLPEQQWITLEELLPHMNPGAVYICEDVHGIDNRFADGIYGLASQLNEVAGLVNSKLDQDRAIVVPSSGAQKLIRSISLYPYLCVLELLSERRDELVAPKTGTEWEPFLA